MLQHAGLLMTGLMLSTINGPKKLFSYLNPCGIGPYESGHDKDAACSIIILTAVARCGLIVCPAGVEERPNVTAPSPSSETSFPRDRSSREGSKRRSAAAGHDGLSPDPSSQACLPMAEPEGLKDLVVTPNTCAQCSHVVQTLCASAPTCMMLRGSCGFTALRSWAV